MSGVSVLKHITNQVFNCLEHYCYVFCLNNLIVKICTMKAMRPVLLCFSSLQAVSLLQSTLLMDTPLLSRQNLSSSTLVHVDGRRV